MSIATCPEEISAGGTRYTHEPRGSLDVYVAEGKRGALDEAEHTWRYCVDNARRKAYFHCAASGKTVWELPDIYPAPSPTALAAAAMANNKGRGGGAAAVASGSVAPAAGAAAAAPEPAAVMKVRGVTERSANRRSGTSSTSSSTIGGGGGHSPSATLVDAVVGRTPDKMTGGGGGGVIRVMAREAAPTRSFEETKRQLQEQLQMKLRERLGASGVKSGSHTPSTPQASPLTPIPSLTSKDPEPTSRTAANETKEVGASTAAPTGTTGIAGDVPSIVVRQATEEPLAPENPQGTRTAAAAAAAAAAGEEEEQKEKPQEAVQSAALPPSSPTLEVDMSAAGAPRGRERGLSLKEKLALHRQRSSSGRRTPDHSAGASPVDAGRLSPVPSGGSATPTNGSLGRAPVAAFMASASAASAASARSNFGGETGAAQTPASPASAACAPDALDEEQRELEFTRIAAAFAAAEIDRRAHEEKRRRERAAAELAKRLAEAEQVQLRHRQRVEQERNAARERRAALERQSLGPPATTPNEGSPRFSGMAPQNGAGDGARLEQAPRYAELLAGADDAAERVAMGAKRLQETIATAASSAIETSPSDGNPISTTVAEERSEEKNSSRATTIEYSNKFTYEGAVRPHPATKLPLKHGVGTYYFDAERATFYRGEWRDDVKHGQGVMSLPHSFYDGPWEKNVPHGRAFVQSTTMQGTLTFLRGTPSGPAALELQSGETFAAKMRDGRAGSTGAILLSTNDKVEWTWANTSSSSSSSSSPLPPGAGSGTGTVAVHFANGDRYVGSVIDNIPHGSGTYYFFERNVEYSGTFIKGVFEGPSGCIARFPDGSVYEGGVKAGLFHGSGVYTVPTDGFVYDGEWRNGQMHGRGTLRFDNGDVWQGTFEKDRQLSGSYVHSELFAL